MVARFVSLAFVYSSILACSALLDADRPQCVSSADCRDLPSGDSLVCSEDGWCIDDSTPVEGRDWACLGNGTTYSQAPFTMEVTFLDIQSRSPVGDVEVTLCRTSDPECASPLEVVTTTEETPAQLSIPDGHSGFLEVRREGYVPELVFFSAWTGDRLLSFDMMLMTEAQAALLADIMGLDPRPEAGTVFMVASDCRMKSAGGIHFDVTPTEEDSVIGYANNGIPLPTLDETQPNDGWAIASNVGPGYVEVTTTLSGTTTQTTPPLAVGTRGGWLTVVTLFPEELPL